ncbi:MAG: RluA family pseudouridine synthase [Flavobacteriales bacterium]|nr:MAG: RluA family pseudouridine synthase [Flavobacteriales bacterium]
MIQEHEDDFHHEEEEELYVHHRFVTDPGQQPLRIDKYLTIHLKNASRNKIQQAAKAGSLRVNNVEVKQNYRVKGNEVVEVVLTYPPREREIIPQDIPLEILYKDQDVVVLNKEAGMVVHPGYGNYSGTLVNALSYLFKDLPQPSDNPLRPGLVHRLDKNTSGVMVVATNDFAMAHLAQQFYVRSTDRTYNALVWGDLEEESGTITGNLGRSLQNRKVMAVFPEGDQGKHAITHYRVLERFGYVTLVECKLETGRTHQIRIHMKHLGHPLFNDPEYGGDKILRGTRFTKYQQFIQNCFNLCPRQALHAKTLGFTHPVTGKKLYFESPLPADMEQLIEKWRNYTKSNP